MKRFIESTEFKGVIISMIAFMNVAFYTWGYPESGAKAAWDVSPLFYLLLQGIFLYAIVGYIYFTITKK